MLARYAYRKDGGLSQQTLANGVKTVKLYDAAGRLQKEMHLNAGGPELWSETSRYDAWPAPGSETFINVV